MRLLRWLLCSLFIMSSVFADVKTIELSRSRSGQTVELEEDFLQYYTSYESRTVNEYGCLPEQVVRPVCRTLPPRNQCGPRSWCHPSPYGPICQTRVICGPVAGGSYCENLPVVENICRNRLVNRNYPVQRSRVLYTTSAFVEVSLDDNFPEGDFEMSLDLTQDVLSYYGTDFGSEYALLFSKQSSNRDREGEIFEEINVRAIHAIDYLAPVTQIPEFRNHFGNRVEFKEISNPYNAPLRFELSLVNRYGHLLIREIPESFIFRDADSFVIDYSFMANSYFYPIRGTLTIKLQEDSRLLNSDQFLSKQISSDFLL